MRSPIVKLICLFLLVCQGAPAAAQTFEVRTLALKDLTADRVLKLAGEVDIYLPPSVKEVWVEKWQPETADLEQEIRAFTVQQAVYWVLAAAILMYVRVKT